LPGFGCAKWTLEDPRINFAISHRGQTPGVNHLGMQAEDDAEPETIHANLQKADTTVVAEKGAHCCYAKSDKYWVTDPQGIAWKSFRSLGSIPLFAGTEPVTAEQPPSVGAASHQAEGKTDMVARFSGFDWKTEEDAFVTPLNVIDIRPQVTSTVRQVSRRSSQ